MSTTKAKFPEKTFPEKTTARESFSGPFRAFPKSGKLKTRKGRSSFKNIVIIKTSRPKQKKRKIGTFFWEQTFRFVTPKGSF
jgi:hypothetical protein